MSLDTAMGRIQEIQSTLVSMLAPASVVSDAQRPGSIAPLHVQEAGDAPFAKAMSIALAGPPSPVVTASAMVPANPGSITGTDIAGAAKKYIGVPYVWGGEDASGMDCSGFVQRVFGDLGIEMPRLVRDQIARGKEITSFADARAGDLISSFDGEHIAIYLGDGKAIDAPVPGRSIQIRDAWEMQENLHKIVRIVPAEAGDPVNGPVALPVNSPSPARTTEPVDLVAAAQAAYLAGAAR